MQYWQRKQHEERWEYRIALEREVNLGCLEHETYTAVSYKTTWSAYADP